MRKRRFIAGVVLLVIGLLLLAGLVIPLAVLESEPHTQTIPARRVLELRPTALTPESFTAIWMGLPNATHIYVVRGIPTASSACSSPADTVASGSGASGSLGTHLSPGATYLVYGCRAGSPLQITIVWKVAGGVTTLEVLTAIGLLLGLFLVAWGLARPFEREPRTKKPDATAWAEVEVADRGPRLEEGSPGRVALGRRWSSFAHDPSRTPRRVRIEPLEVMGRRSPRGDRGRTAGFRSAASANAPQARLVQGCPSCGRVYTRGRHPTCPACGASFENGSGGPGGDLGGGSSRSPRLRQPSGPES